GGDLHEEGVAAPLLIARGARAPGVEALGGDAEGLAHRGHGPDVLVLLDEGEDHSASLAKNAVAFFKMSRSICSRLFSARSWRNSSSMAGRLPLPGKAWSPCSWKACFQWRSRLSPSAR